MYSVYIGVYFISVIIILFKQFFRLRKYMVISMATLFKRIIKSIYFLWLISVRDNITLTCTRLFVLFFVFLSVGFFFLPRTFRADTHLQKGVRPLEQHREAHTYIYIYMYNIIHVYCCTHNTVKRRPVFEPD